MSGTEQYLLDTNIVLYLLSGDIVLADLIGNNTPYISFITEMELLSFAGFTRSDENKLNEFLHECHIIDINSRIKEIAIKIRKASRLKLPDSVIAATSEYLNIPLLTADIDFEKMKSLNVILYKKS